MALDPSIYARFAAPKSVAEFDREAYDAENAKTAGGLNKLRLLAGQRAEADAQRVLQEQTGVRNALSGLGSGATDEQRVNALRTLATPTGFAQADALEKSLLERQKTRAEVDSKGASADETRVKAMGERIKTYRGALDFIDTPQGAVRWLQAQYADPAMASHMQALGPIEQAVQRIPQDPQGFETWRQRAGMGMEAFEKQIADRADKAATRDLTKRGQDLTDSRIRSEGAANRGVTMRGQNLTDDRARDLNATNKTDKEAARKEAQVDKEVTKFSTTLQKEGVPEIEASLQGAEAIFAKYTDPKTGKAKDIPGIGPIKNALPDWAVSSEGKDARESLSAVANIVLSARSGAAVTDQELRRLARELSNSVGAGPDDMQRAYRKFRDRFEKVKANLSAGVSDAVKETYEERGGIPIKRGGATAGEGALSQAEAAELAELRKRFGK